MSTYYFYSPHKLLTIVRQNYTLVIIKIIFALNFKRANDNSYFRH